MGRTSKIWQRKGRPGWFATINGKQMRVGNTREEADRQFHLLKSRDTAIAHGSHTIPELVMIYLDDCLERLAPDTYRHYYVSLTAWRDDYAKLKPVDMRPYHLTRWLKAHPDWSPTTAATRGADVKTWSAWCRREGYLEINQLRDARLPTSLKRAPAPAEDLAKLLDAITDPFFLDYFHVLYDTGARPGEIASLTADRVHWSASTALVQGKTGYRSIGLTSRAFEILKRCYQNHAEGPLLLTSRGATWNDYNRHRHLLKWEAIAGCETHVTSYHLRHDLRRRWKAAGVGALEVAAQLGHKKEGRPHLDELISTYAHVSPAELASSARQCEASQIVVNRPAGRAKRG